MGRKEGEIWTWKQSGRTDRITKRSKMFSFPPFIDMDLERSVTLMAKEATHSMMLIMGSYHFPNIGHVIIRLLIRLHVWLTGRWGSSTFLFDSTDCQLPQGGSFVVMMPSIDRYARSIKSVHDVSHAAITCTAAFLFITISGRLWR